ncbi:MFS transporter [Streptomyces sp. NBC_01387]|uniref:MFS transporter n=1 Tax=unclassified Streptomyces TaxID=2593676 RepID=UPI002025774A|nr:MULTISPECIES: MFS transporter [unclassified Streptomyces]MCX4550131.1 MFS transporter [Streptomyces sp. NBC_01500]WSC21626.1 MFS transporter [Streptomyces sp. NBC_01766]WSV55586.1 MFS transporter [Streptomyces sp. NBC_01014]
MSSGPGADSAPAPQETSTRTSMFSSLKIRNYRLFATGAVVSNTGTWMARITQDWLVLSITGSSAAVGITTAMQFLPMLLFGLYGGVIADRFPKRTLLFFTQGAMSLGGLFLAVLTLTGHVEVWHVYVTAFFTGLVTVVDNPTRQSFVSEMVGPDQVRNAVSLNSANFQSARLIGPAVASGLTAAVGPGWAFLANGLSFLAPLTGLMLMRTSELHHTKLKARGKGQLRDGLNYVSKHPDLIWPIVLVGFVGTFGFNFPIWLSAFANDTFHGGVGMYGLFNTLMAVGSLVGALLAARRGTSRLRVLVGAAIGFGLLQVVAAWMPSVWIFTPLIVVIGILGLTTNVTANSTVQMGTEPEMRGRVMSLFMMVFTGGTPLGGPLFGWLTDTYGVRISFTLGGGICALAAMGVGLMLARAANLRLEVDLRRGRRHVAFVPREQLATAA